MKVKWNRRLDGFPLRDQRPVSIELEYGHVGESDVSVSLQNSEKFFDEHKDKKPKGGRFLNIFKLITKKQKTPEFEQKIRNEKHLQSRTDYYRCQYHTSLLPTSVESSGSSTSVAIEGVLWEVMATPEGPSHSEEAATENASRGKTGNTVQTSAILSPCLDPNIACQEKYGDKKYLNWETTSISSTDSNSESKSSSVNDECMNYKLTFETRTNKRNQYSETVIGHPKQRRPDDEHVDKSKSLEMVKDNSDISKDEKLVQLTPCDLQESSTCASASHSRTLLNRSLPDKAKSKEINKKVNVENSKLLSARCTVKQARTNKHISTKKSVGALKEPEKLMTINKSLHKTQQQVTFGDQLPVGVDTWSCKSFSSVITNEISPFDDKDGMAYWDKQTKDVKQKRHLFAIEQAKNSTRESKKKDIFPPSKFTANHHETKARVKTYLKDETSKGDFETDLDFSKVDSVKITRTGWSSQDMIVLRRDDPPRRMGNHRIPFQNQKERIVDLVWPDSQRTAQNQHERPDVVTSCGQQRAKEREIVSSSIPSNSLTLSTFSSFHKTGDIKRSTWNARRLPQTSSGPKEDTPASSVTKTCNCGNLESHLENLRLFQKYSDISSLTLSQLEKLVLHWVNENGNPLHFSDKKERRPDLTAEYMQSQREYVEKIQRLEALCETRTKELGLMKMQLKHAFLGFYSFSIVVKYMTEELDALSHSSTLLELKKTREDFQKAKAQLRDYETQLEQLNRNRAEEIKELNSKLTATHKEETETLAFNHHEEFRKLRAEYDKEIEDLKNIHAQSVRDAQNQNSQLVAALKEQHNRQIEELEKGFAKQMQQASESHEKALDTLKQQLQDLQKQMESNLQGDTDTKLQRVLDQKRNLQKEVESLKTVLEFKVGDIHRLQKENLEMQEELEKLPSALQEIQKLKARNEDLQAMVDEKVQIERQLKRERLQLEEEFEKEVKSKSRLSMEKEELQWRLKQTMEANALLSTISDSPSEILDKLSNDESLLKCPVRMSVFLNELDTSQVQGERGSGNHRQVTAWGSSPSRVSSRKNCNYSGGPSFGSSPSTPTAKKIRYSKQSDSVDGTPKQSHSNKLLIQERDRNDNSSVTEAHDDQGTRKRHIENDDQTPKQQRMRYYAVNVSQNNLNLNVSHPRNDEREDEESHPVPGHYHYSIRSDAFCPKRTTPSLIVCQNEGSRLLEFTDNKAQGSREKVHHEWTLEP